MCISTCPRTYPKHLTESTRSSSSYPFADRRRFESRERHTRFGQGAYWFSMTQASAWSGTQYAYAPRPIHHAHAWAWQGKHPCVAICMLTCACMSHSWSYIAPTGCMPLHGDKGTSWPWLAHNSCMVVRALWCSWYWAVTAGITSSMSMHVSTCMVTMHMGDFVKRPMHVT